MKTFYKRDWENGITKHRLLTRSFKTLEDAQKFAKGKANAEIYISKGLFKVSWRKITAV